MLPASSCCTQAFDFFTYSELIYWFVFAVAINPFRWKWALFVFFGISSHLPAKIVEEEDRLRNGLGNRSRYVDGERPACYEHRPRGLDALSWHRTWRTQGCLLYLVALLHLSSFFRFDVLVTVHLYDLL